MRAGAVMLVGVAAANGGNYLFHLIAARKLGPDDYGDLVALLTLSSLVSLPLGALQIVVSRYVARFTALGTPDQAARTNRRVALGTGAFAIVVLLLMVVLAPLLQRWLSISSAWSIALTALLTLPSALTPLVWGVAQGLQRFTLLAASMCIGTIARIVPLVVFVVLGLSTPLAIAATLIGMVVSMAYPLVPLRSWFTRPAQASGPAARVEGLLRATAPAAVALLAFTSLTQTDVLAANATFGDTASGVYGAASLVGRVILYLPAAVVAVLLPKVAARTASNESAQDILGLSLLATFVFCVASTVVYAVASHTIVDVAFGAKYADAAALLVPFGIAMTALALVNVLLYYELGRGDTLFAWILGAGAVAQVVAFALFHQSPRRLIVDTIVVSIGVLVAHEVTSGRTMTSAAAHAARGLVRRAR